MKNEEELEYATETILANAQKEMHDKGRKGCLCCYSAAEERKYIIKAILRYLEQSK